MTRWTRRDVLEAALAGAGVAAWPWGGAFAQSGGAGLLRAPRQALVIGNGKYRRSPLSNPVNDARGMAAALKEVGFGVVLGVESTQAAMREAIQAFSENLAKSKAIGLFYFAGHGAQLAWRNYLLPVDAEVADVQELRERAVDLNGLIEGIRNAGNPMNMIILDACRDNPFGSAARVDQKGLSQLDAPPGTLLAYATAPGNTAIDGDGGGHGLYTEHLLREIKVPETKVEDVFKRVRLAVRRRSKGLQIPWESTSLEEDFWFIPPQALKTTADDEAGREFMQELALWEKIQNATQPEPFEDYLRRYPSGRFAELAQLRLDRVLETLGEKKVEVLSPPENPYSKGTARANITWRVGDSYTYRHLDLLSNAELRPVIHSIVDISGDEVRYGSGLVTDLLGNVLRRTGGRIYSPNQLEPVDYVVGKRWVTQFRVTTSKGVSARNEMDLRIVTREKVTVPAGTFDAFRIEGDGLFEDDNGQVEETRLTKWMAPDQVRREILMEETRSRGGGGRTRRDGRRAGRRPGRKGLKVTLSRRWELMSFRQS